MNRKIFVISWLLLWGIASVSFAITEKSNSLVTEAWKAWEQNDQQLVEQKFRTAIEADRNNSRAYLGLSYLYSFQEKYQDAWMVFKNVLEKEQNIYPYISTVWLAPKFRKNFDAKNSGIIDLLKDLSKNAEPGNTLKAMANEMLGDYYLEKGELSKAKLYYQNMNAITDWLLIGPFDNIAASGYDKVYPPEMELDTSKSYAGKNGVPARWFAIKALKHNCWIDFLNYFAYDNSAFYANNFVYCPQKQTVQIRIGTSGSFKFFLNDELAMKCFDENNNDLETYIMETELQQGWNKMLIKVGYSEIEQCNFMLRITDAQGEAIDGLRFSTEQKMYTSKPGAPQKIIENFAEAFFKQKIKENPDHLENYLLLADCYLRNDKANEAELILRDAIKLSPNCALFYHHILEAYRRHEKYDEITTTLDKIYSLDKNIPYVLYKKISDKLDIEDIDSAEELMTHLEQLMPESESVYELYLGLYATKQQFEKLIDITSQAYKKYPTNWYFVFLQAFLSIQKTKKFDDAIKIYQKYLARKHTSTAFSNLADVYLKASNIDKWEKTNQACLEFYPAASGTYYNMATTYLSLQDYNKAEKAINKALEICPNASAYWSTLGEIYRIKNKIDRSKHAYQQALNYRPTDYDSRNALRELEGKKSIFSHFDTVDIDSLVKHSPDKSSYPNDNAVILLRDARRVVYEQGASEVSNEELVKVFNSNGIDEFKQKRIVYNPYIQELIVEKAVVIKKDGSEIEADIDENHIVFKSMTDNDCLYLKWKIRNYYSGKLANHFWDTFNFNNFYPIKKIQYALLVPDHSFKFNTQNMPNEPQKRQTEDGMLYKWSLHDEPAIQPEYGMPELDDIGKILYISSIPDWEFLVEWYADLVRTRPKSSFEIKELVGELFKPKIIYSNEEKIRLIYNFITENITYSSVLFRQSGLIPQKARDVLVNRIGDCKDMATLFIAMLKEVGIQGYYVLLQSKNVRQNQEILPFNAFNHCIIAVETKTGLKYLDPTAHNYPMESLPEMEFDGFSLLIKPGVKAPNHIKRDEVGSSNIFRKIIVKLREDNSINVVSSSVKTGNSGTVMRDAYRNKSIDERGRILSEILSRDFPNVKLLDSHFDNLDTLTYEVRYNYEFQVPNYISEANQYKFLKIPWADPLKTDPSLSYEQRKYPYCYWVWSDTVMQEIAIQLPAGFKPVDLPENVKFSCSAADYSLSLSFSKGIIIGRRELINKKRFVLPVEYDEFKEFYNNVIKEDGRQILLKK